jgi:hypothetical protein
MSARKQGLTRRQHVELGGELLAVHNTLTNAAVVLGNGYLKSSRTHQRLRHALKYVDSLRAALDSISAAELPDEDWSPLIYFGANRDRRAEWLAAHPLDGPDA